MSTTNATVTQMNTTFTVPTSVVESEVHAAEIDVLSQFKANMQQVEDLNKRLRFVMSEVSHLIKKV